MPPHRPGVPGATHLALTAMPTPAHTGTKAERTGALNDAFRRTMIGGRVMLTRSVAELPHADLYALLAAVQAFDVFDADNDPFGEHDFGALDHAGERWFWKIDAYDADMRFGSPDPSDPAVTTRVMTIMRADEY